MIAIDTDLLAADMTPTRHLSFFREEYPETKLDISCYNGPNNYVVAGATADIETLESYLKSSKANGERIRYKVMRGMHAYHCALVDSILSHSAELCAPVDYRETTFAFETCHEGPWDIPGGDIIARNTRGAVYFTQAISRIVNRLGSCTFLEAGIGGPIISMARNALLQSQSQHIFISIGAKDPVQSLADATVSLWKAGQSDLQFWPFHREERSGYVPTALPSYQFEKNGHWIEYTGIPNHTENRNVQPPQQSQQPRTCPHCLKDTSDFSYISRDDSKGQSGNQYNFTIDIRSRRYQDLVKGHAVVGSPICPAGMYLELASHAITLLPDAVYISAPWEIVSQGLDIKAPLGLDAKRAVTLSLTNQAKNLWEFELSSTRNQSTQTSHATGVICLQQGNRRNSSEGGSDRAKWDRISNLLDEDEDTESLRGTMVYKVFGKMAKYSPPYKGIKYLVGKGVEGAGDIKMPGQDLDAIAKSPNSKIADPLLMDNFLQVAGAFVHSLRESERELDDEISCVCTGMGLVGPLSELHGSGVYRVYTKILQEDKKQILLDVFAFDKKTKLMIWSAKGLKFARIPRNLLSRIVAVASPEWNLEEQAIKLPKPIAPGALPVPEPSQQTTFPVTSEDTSKNYTSIDVFSDVQDILSESLNVDIQEIIMEAWMEDLGANPLIGSEILALVTTKYDIDIATDAFAMVTTVKSLCELISDHLSIGAAQIKKDEDIGDKKPDLSVEVANQTPPDWQKTIFEILSRSLELNIVEIKMESKMEDLGADSLVAAEIVSHLNDAFKLSASPTDFATVEDVKSLCDFISTALGIAPLKRRISSSASDSSETPYSTLITSETKDLELVSPTSDEKQASIQDNARSLWESFRRIRRRFDHHAIENKLAGFWDHVYPQQLSAVASFIVEAFEKLGCPIKTFTQGEKLPELQNTLPRWHREVPRLWEILEEAGIVERAGESFVRGSARIQNDGDNLTVRLISDFPQYTSSHGLFQLIGPHLADCLTGKIDPVSILFGSKMGRNLLADYYANAPDLNTATKVLCEFFSAAIQDRSPNPDHEPFRILEIGAGTGGTTKHLVPVLQATGLPFTYTFTDISASLLTHAKRTTFKGIAGVEFRKLNIEEDPSEDLLGRYHIVLSTNCIHATHKLRGSLANIRKLVRPDGCVALVEVGQKRAWYELVWGLLDGWWFFNDDRTYPLQSPWEWERAMHDTGFADVDWSESASRESRDVRVICGMANEVKNSFSTKATSMLLHRGSTSADRNLFLIPDGFGSGAVFGALTPLLQRITDLSVYALNSPFLRNIPNLESQTSLEELAGIYVTEIKRRQPRGPYLIGGYSIGGVIAYEAVRQLLEAQNEVEKLFLFDTICPTLGNCLPDNLAEFLDSIRTIGMTNGNAIRRLIMSDHFAFSRQLLMRYQVSKLPGKKTPPVVLVSAKEGVDKQDEIPRPKVRPEEQNIADWFLDDRTGDESFGWNGLLGSGNVSVIRADGSHFSLMLSSKIHGWGSNFVDLLV
ncbi:hypothetical protein PENVUL_c001G00307 [Penicillium vulpinum]|uniref:Uncharacterized protein n=1 Tax=Penicillium vulpinum TaxID=29845 RepID=A0A1V6SEF7_9EURO|nr:hypothetical protein PENVUL_c001G00307 [Penicillium vulpinum]